MKIVGLEANDGLCLGVIEGDQMVDLQALDPRISSDLREWLRAKNPSAGRPLSEDRAKSRLKQSSRRHRR
jgi:hypothetical protein